MKRSCIFTIIQLNHSIIHDIEHFITEGKSFMVYGTYHENNVPPPGYHHNGFVTTQALGHMMYGYTLLVPMNQGVLSKLSKEYNRSGHK